jgi:hypothetical protein
MKRPVEIVLWLVALAAPTIGLPAVTHAVSPDSPYHVIARRNVFNLHDPPRTNEPPHELPPTSNVKLTGITSLLGVKRAFFEVSLPAERGKPPGKEQSFIIEEGERQGVIEVLQINERAATVTIRNEGVEAVLALDKSPGLPSSPTGPPTPGMAGESHIRPPGVRPNMPYRHQSADTEQRPNPQPLGFAQAAADAGPDPKQSHSLATTQSPPDPDMSLEQKVLLTEIERQRMQPLIDQGLYPPIPDTLGLQTGQAGNQGNDGAATLPSAPSAQK